MKNQSFNYMFLTNNSSHNADFYVRRLAGMGLSTDRSRILTSGEATCAKLKELYPGKRAFLLGNEFLAEEFREAGIPVDDDRNVQQQLFAWPGPFIECNGIGIRHKV